MATTSDTWKEFSLPMATYLTGIGLITVSAASIREARIEGTALRIESNGTPAVQADGVTKTIVTVYRTPLADVLAAFPTLTNKIKTVTYDSGTLILYGFEPEK